MDSFDKSKSDNTKENNMIDNQNHCQLKKPKRTNWLFGEGICEICGVRNATRNLKLDSGSHRECFSCWED